MKLNDVIFRLNVFLLGMLVGLMILKAVIL